MHHPTSEKRSRSISKTIRAAEACRLGLLKTIKRMLAPGNTSKPGTQYGTRAGECKITDLGSPSSFKHGGIAPHLGDDHIKKHKFQPVSTFINSSLVIIALLLCEEIADVILNETAKDESQAPGRRL
ncbi:hypothetical protein ABKN59_011428 [Abortiporus biennis]